MRFPAIMLFMACLSGMSVRAQSPRAITLSIKNQPFEEVLKQIRKQTNYTFFYNEEVLEKVGKISLNVQKADLVTVLNLCLENKSITYNIQGTTIILIEANNPRTPEGDIIPVMPFINGKVSGFVRNSRNEGLSDASIVVKRTGKGTVSSANGSYAVENVRSRDTLVISFIGYNTLRVPILGRSEIDIFLEDASNQLDEVVKQAYSNTSQRLATGNIVKVSAAEIAKQPVMNPLMALQGRVPGLVVTPTTGFASSPVRMEIRGLNSLNSTVPSDPLYVIDGVPLTVLSTGFATNRISPGFAQGAGYAPTLGTTGGQSPLFSINPKDIESIEILKDADATAVYGARGSNGVILITTKKGKPGKTKFDFNVNPPFLSIGKTARYLKTMNTQQYLQARRSALRNDGIIPTLLNAPDLLYWDTTRYTDWQKETLGGRAKSLDVSAGISGGTDQTSFRVNAAYEKLTNTTNISGATERITLGSNLNINSRDQKFSMNLTANFAYSYVDVVQPVTNATFAPNAPGVFDENGDPNWKEWNVNGLFSDNNLYPFGSNLSPANPQATTALTSSLTLAYKPFTGLTIGATLGYNFAYNTSNLFASIASQNPYQLNLTGSAVFSTTQNAGWAINPQISYTTQIGKGDLQLNLVATEQSVATNGATMSGYGYTNDILLTSINNAAAASTITANSRAKNASFVGGINYVWERKYIINLNGTRQGSSKFGPDNTFGSFGSVGVAWIASEEKWIKKWLPSVISFLKFRGSYGLTGSDGIADYQYLALWQVRNADVNGYNNQITLRPSVRPNQKYRWEENRKLELASNIGLLDDKISMNIAYYRNRVTNQLTSYPTPSFINTPEMVGVVTNIPLLLENSGWEGSISARLVTTPNFSLSSNFNISHNKNKLVSFPNLSKTPYAGQYEIGNSLNTVYTYHYLGIDPLTGRIALQDLNNDGRITTTGGRVPVKGSDDRGVLFDLQPKFTGGFGLSGNFKKLGFSIFFNYTKQTGANIYANSVSPGTFNQNLPLELLNINRWQKPGDIASFPATTTYNVGMGYGDFAYSDASFIRLNNINITYPLPETWIRKIGLNHLALSLSAQNVLTITRYAGGDPEVAGNFTSLPPANLYTLRLIL